MTSQWWPWDRARLAGPAHDVLRVQVLVQQISEQGGDGIGHLRLDMSADPDSDDDGRWRRQLADGPQPWGQTTQLGQDGDAQTRADRGVNARQIRRFGGDGVTDSRRGQGVHCSGSQAAVMIEQHQRHRCAPAQPGR
ncbi:Uncharacterised protein [Nocardia africana]|uniref:Uncharacterized protein n=1 Tax=Nocardia africana TaxID=134964 RepID=A0A378WQ36_9NOCA|nr:Uncharacterised protein [Nocardia africana]